MIAGSDLSNGVREEIKTQFYLPEGVYRQASLADILRPNRNQQAAPSAGQTTAPVTSATPGAPVQISFCTYRPVPSLPPELETRGDGSTNPNAPDETELVCFNYGRELYTYSVPNRHSHRTHEYACRDKRSYKGTFPTSHDFNRFLATREHNPRVLLVVGFSLGQVQVIDPLDKEPARLYNRLFNEDRSIEKSRVTCARWVPNSANQFLVAHASGQLYLYSEDLACGPGPPHYQLHKAGEQFSVHSCKAKAVRNPLYRWCIGCTHLLPSTQLPPLVPEPTSASASKATIKLFGGSSDATTSATSSALTNTNGLQTCNATGQLDAALTGSGVMQALQSGTLQAPSTASVNAFAFSPCTRFLAVVSGDGQLRVFDYSEMELMGSMRSYFGALLCCAWSPDSHLVAAGGEDDMIGVWSLLERRVLCRAQGHRSWVTRVAFDTFMGLSRPAAFALFDADDEDEPNATDALNVMARRGDAHNASGLSQIRGPSPMTLAETDRRLKRSSTLSIPPSGAQPLYYRFASVGQDTLLCFWELEIDNPAYLADSNVPPVSAPISLNGSQSAPDSHATWTPRSWKPSTSASASASSTELPLPMINGKNSFSRKGKDILITAPSKQNGITLQRFSTLNTSSETQQATPGVSLATDEGKMTSQKRRTSNGSSSSRLSDSYPDATATATGAGTADRERNGKTGTMPNAKTEHVKKKERKKYFAISWGRKDALQNGFTKSGSTASNSLFNRHNHVVPTIPDTSHDLNVPVTIDENGTMLPSQIQLQPKRRSSSPSTSGYGSALGTPSCPRLEQVPILEPLASKRIAHDRLSEIIFRQDCVVTACHECIVNAWLRPGRPTRAAGVDSRSTTMSEPTAHSHDGFESSGSGHGVLSTHSSFVNAHDVGATTTVHTFASAYGNEASYSYSYNRSAASRNSKPPVANAFGTPSVSPYAAYSFK